MSSGVGMNSDPGTSSQMLSGPAAVRLVAGRELRERTRTNAFRWGTVAMLVLAGGLALLPRLLPEGTDPEWTVAVAGQAPAGFDEAVEAVAQVESATITLEPTSDPAEEVALRSEIDAVLVDGTELVAEGEVSDRLQILLGAAIAQARLVTTLDELGVSPEEGAELLAPEPLTVRSLAADDEGARQAVAAIGSIVLFVAILTYGGWVLYSALEEKANRIVEIIVSAIRPTHLLAGKVIAFGIIGVGQLSLIVAAAAAVAAVAGTLPDLPDFVPVTVAWALLWFALGFAFYAVGYATAGALTARQEDAQSASSPILTLVMISYFASLFVVSPDPHSPAARVLSLLPPAAPMAMPARIASGEVPVWEIAASLVLMVLAIAGITAVAGRVYERALLRGGGRVKFTQVLRGG